MLGDLRGQRRLTALAEQCGARPSFIE